MLHSDNVHRSSGQIIPAARRAFLGAQLCASPTLVEPFFLAEIQSDQKVLSKIYSLIFKKRGSVIEEVPKEGSDLVVLRSYLPVLVRSSPLYPLSFLLLHLVLLNHHLWRCLSLSLIQKASF